MSRRRTGVAVLVAAIGMTAGALLGAPLSGHLGRRPLEILSAAVLGLMAVLALVLTVRRRRARERSAAFGELRERGSEVTRAGRLVARFTEGEHKTFYLAMVMLTFEAVTAVFEWYPLAYLIDYLKGDRGPLPILHVSSQRVGTVAVLTGAIVLLAMANSAADSLAEIFLARGGRTFGFRLRVAMFSHLQRLPLGFHDRSRKGDVTFRVVGDVKEFESFVIDSLSDLAGSVLLLVATIIFIAFQSWQVALVGLTVVPVLALISNYFAQRIKAAAKRQRAREGDLASATQEMLNSIRVVQAFGRGGHDERQFVDHSRKAMTAALEAARLEALFSWLVSFVQAVSIALVIWIGLWLIDHGTMTVGMLVLLTVLIGQMFKPTRKIIKEWNTVAKVLASVERINDLLEREVTVRDEPGAVPAPALRGQVEFRNVTFAYEGAQDRGSDVRPAALQDVSFAIAPGEVVALAGPSGAGKTTIAQLLPRLYDPEKGAVLLDGVDVRDFTLDSVRSQVSMVLQDTVLLSGTVAENIAYGLPDATREEIVAAATRAHADEFIEQLPEGYDTDLSEQAINLSGGQRQRIAIARALIRNTPILVLDEPTTGLDADSAALVLAGLRELMRDKATLLISHDLELIRSADRILTISAGSIVESGTHEELLGRGGAYAELQTRHSGSDNGDSGARRNGRSTGLDPALLSPLRNPHLRHELPGIPAALDESVMRRHLEEMLDKHRGRWQIARCEAGKALYMPGEGCLVRYKLLLEGTNGDGMRETLVGARLFSDPESAHGFLRERLAPLAERVRGHDEIAPFSQPVTEVEGLGMAMYAFPIDAELPALIQATDSDAMLDRLRDALAEEFGSVELQACRAELAHYPRRGRCTVRYDLDGIRAASGRPVSLTVYGKLGGDPLGLTEPVLTALRDRELKERDRRIRIPRPLGEIPDLHLALVEAIPGSVKIPELLEKRARTAGRQLEEAIDSSARVAAALHSSEIDLGPTRTLEQELRLLDLELESLRGMAPDLAAELEDRRADIEVGASHSGALPLALSHGDFTPAQVLFGQGRAGVVDFDEACQAEPALDLGRFSAYLRFACRKSARTKQSADFGEDLCERLRKTYANDVGVGSAELERLRARVETYEALALAHVAIRGWFQLKPARTTTAMELLEERIACSTR